MPNVVQAAQPAWKRLLQELAPEGLRPLSRGEYETLAESGAFEQEAVELLHGLLVRVSPQGPGYSEAIDRLAEALIVVLAGRARVRVQGPFAASEDSQPEPDIAVYASGDYSRGHPSQAMWVIEVSSTSLTLDRGVKRRLYAGAQVAEYWLLDLVHRRLEVYQSPQGGDYTSVLTYEAGSSASPGAFPELVLSVSGLLPG